MSLQNVKLHLVDSIDDLLRMYEWMGQRREHHVLAFDTETTGLTVGCDVVRLVQVGDAEHGWVLPWANEVGARGRFIGGWAGAFADIVKKWDGDWLAHNAKYDVGMLDHMRVKMPRDRVKDTRIMVHCLQPHMSTALKNATQRLIDASAPQAAELLSRALSSGSGEGGWTWATVPIDFQDYWTYAGLDPVLTYQLFEHVWPRVQADCPEAFQLENEVSWVIEKMERYGAHIDVPFARVKFNEFEAYVHEAANWIKAEYGVAAGSNASIIRILQEAGFEFTKATASGAVALDKEVLEGIDHPLAETVLQRRRVQKLASTYLSHFVHEVDRDDLIHPSINVLGARTSRMSMERPNLQNLPRKNTVNPAADAVRSCITARDGHKMMMCDFDQVEMRMLASMANERSMIEAFRGTEDFFVALAKMVYEDESIVKADPRRQVVKNAGYATIYGSGIPKFAVTAGIPLEQAQKVRRRWDELFPGVVQFQRDVIRIATERRVTEGMPYVRCPVTRRRQVGDAGKEYALVNYLIQGAAAAVFKKKLIELDNAGLGDWMVAPVHDEIILDVPEEEAPSVAQILQQVMNDDSMFEVPLSASVSWGDSWGSKEAYE